MRRIVFILCFTPIITFSQSITRNLVSVASNSETKEKINLSYSIGEVLIPTTFQGNKTLTQGFQQPEFIIPENKNDLFSKLKILCYPNPVVDYLNIHISDFDNQKKIVIRVFDVRGSEVDNMHGNLTDKTYIDLKLNCSELLNSLYFVQVVIDNYYVTSFEFYKAQD